jgi:hypothetical protein
VRLIGPLRSTLVAAATALVVAGLAMGSCSLRTSVPDSGPGQPGNSPTAGAEPTHHPEPTFRRSEYPSGLVARLPDRDVDLPADTSCWTDSEHCRRALLPLGSDSLPDLGPQDAIDIWFARPGWSFGATFRRVGEDCPRATTVKATRTDDQWFRLTPADQAGQYEVEVYGEGPEGLVSTRFVWTTTSDGPVDPPRGLVGLYPESRGEGSFALEVMVDDLAFHPSESDLSRVAEVTVAAADGTVRTLTTPLIRSSLDCGSRGNRGYFYYQQEWDEDFAVLGRGPFDLEVVFTVRDTTYVGSATWKVRGRPPPYAPLTVTPPLPAAAH